jgi:glycosyltransferase involved in cell wall biosynthesis
VVRILHLADRLTDRGGAYTFLLGLLEGLARDHEQGLAVGEDDGSARAACAVTRRAGLEARLGAPVALDDLVQELAPDVVHVHNVVNPCVLEWAAGRPRTVLTVQDHRFFCPTRGKWTSAGHACRDTLSREVCASCFDDAAYFEEVLGLTERRLAAARRMPAVTVLSRYMAAELGAAGVDRRRIRVVPPFVHGLEGPAVADGPPCVLFVGRLVEAKGVRDAVLTWRSSGVDLPLVVAGTGPLRDELERLARAGGSPGLEVLGWVGRDRLPALYRRARALLMPSRWQEPFGIVGLEALSFGVPVVAWESGGIAEWHPGPLVRWGDVDALARELAVAVTQRGPGLSRFTRDEALAGLLAVYREVGDRQ